ncbi:hypothetical protein BpHYR1_016350, partial [Brachionus plicatilis]
FSGLNFVREKCGPTENFTVLNYPNLINSYRIIAGQISIDYEAKKRIPKTLTKLREKAKDLLIL